VKAADKVKKDVAELSLSDFHPKRFALNYDPPMISKYPMSLLLLFIKYSSRIFGPFHWQTLPPQNETPPSHRRKHSERSHDLFTKATSTLFCALNHE